jgi:N-methylhydantoinase A/oxoprolinase/acetone carboxylase beta subunit
LLAVIERQQTEAPHGSQIRFAQRLHADAALLDRLPQDEMAAWERLAKGPVDLERANIDERGLSRALARLERKGLAIYSGFTPTDAAHVLGLSTHWNRAAAVAGARVWARQMRHLYGLGTWVQGDAEGPARQVVDKVIDTICQKLVEAGLNDAGQMNEANAGKMAALLTGMVLHGNRHDGTAPVFALKFAPDVPLVAVGAPAASYYPPVAQALGVRLELPRFAEVANAVGAVLGQVSQRVHLTVSQPVRGVYRVFARTGPRDFGTVAQAIGHAQELASAEAMRHALDAGAAHATITLSQIDNQVHNDIDGDMFFEARVTATASGPPRMRTAREPVR